MACTDELFIGDEGTSIRFLIKECDDTDPDNPVEVLVNVSAATAMEITFLKPDGSTEQVNGSFVTDGTDSLVHYLTVIGDLDQDGYWEAQLRITLPTGKWYASKINFNVNTPL